MQLALVERGALGAAALGLVLRDDLGCDVNKVLLLVVFDEVQALRGGGVLAWADAGGGGGGG